MRHVWGSEGQVNIEMKGRLILLGIDGASYAMIQKLATEGTLPNLQRLIQGGALKRMQSSIPEVSPVAWHSIITGGNPAEHGTFGFTDLAPGTYRTIFNGLPTLKMAPFWEQEGAGRSVILNVPFTYPARPLNGVHIAGYVALDLAKATYPPDLVPELERLGYRVDVDSRKAHQSLTLFLKDLDKTLDARIAVYRHLWEHEDWQTLMLVVTGTDRLSHFLWDAYLDPAHRYHDAFIEYFQRVDAVVGEIADRMQEQDVLVMVSDHGFESAERSVYVNAVLRQAGLLRFETERPKNLKAIAPSAKAFALEPSRIYLHAQGKYPKGAVTAAEKAELVEDIITVFRELRFEGRRVIRRVFRKEEIYHGPEMARAPDVVLLAAPGFDLRSGLKSKQIFGEEIFTGKHARDEAILLVYGPRDLDWVPDHPNVTDVVGIMQRLRGVEPDTKGVTHLN